MVFEKIVGLEAKMADVDTPMMQRSMCTQLEFNSPATFLKKLETKLNAKMELKLELSKI